MAENILVETFESDHDASPKTSLEIDVSATTEELLGSRMIDLIRGMLESVGSSKGRRIVISIASAPIEVERTPPPVPPHASFDALGVAERKPIIGATLAAASILDAIDGPKPSPEAACIKMPKGCRIVFWDYFDSVHTFDRVPPLGILEISDERTTIADVALCMRAVQDVAAEKAGRVVGRRVTVPFRPLEEPDDVLWLHGMDPGDIVKGHLSENLEITSYSAQSHMATINLQLIGDLWENPKTAKRRAAESATVRQSLADLASLTQPNGRD